MAFDPNEHVIDPASGFQRHKVTGHMIGIEQAPAKRVSDETEYPKWVLVHEGHVKHHAMHGYVTTPAWGEPHIDRATNEIKVLVHNEDEEVRATSAPEA
jgi:hypothetical protein